jgi:hypothetical protein
MAVFNFITNPNESQFEQAVGIHNKYFHIDTISVPDLREWIAFNPYMDTYAMRGEKVEGFFNIIPLTTRCAELMARQEIKEEDIGIEHMLPYSKLRVAEYAYFAAIAVCDKDSYVGKQCVAALISVTCSHLLNGYAAGRFKALYANPTTFWGNHLVRKLGLKPLYSHRKPLRAGNDIYSMEMNQENRARLKALGKHYSRFVATNPLNAT